MDQSFLKNNPSYSDNNYRDSFRLFQSNDIQPYFKNHMDLSYNMLNSNSHEDCPSQISSIGPSSESKPTTSITNFGKCKICDAKATGIHYGVASCEGCKGFYKRSTIRKETYRCYFGNNCKLSPENRNSCKACRLRRCIESGMSTQGSKMGRKPNSEKHLYSNNNLSENGIESLPSNLKTPHYNSSNRYHNYDQNKEISELEAQQFSNHKNTSISIYNRNKINESRNDKISYNQLDENNNSIKSIIKQIIQYKNKNEHQFESEPIIFDFDRHKLNFFSISNTQILQKTFQNSSLDINRYHSLNSSNSNIEKINNLIVPFLRDKVYQVFIKTNSFIFLCHERALNLVRNNIKTFEGHDASLQQVWNGLIESISVNVKNLVSFARQVPGFNQLNDQDFNHIVNNRLFDYFMIKHACLFIDGESYMILPNNIQYTKYWLNKVVGDEMTNAMFDFSIKFNNLEMTQKEIALLLAYLLTIDDPNLENKQFVKNLNDFYFKAIMYEFNLNRRNDKFVSKWQKLMAVLPELNELQLKNIRNLTPII